MNRFLAALALACALSGHAWAGSHCAGHYLGGQPPVLAQTVVGTVELCSSAFATLHNPTTRDPIYAAEHLTPANLIKADKTARIDAFAADPRLPGAIRAELSDYNGSGFDRGHLAPAHDMPGPAAMHESFVLSNMAPQEPSINRGAWAAVEEFTRRLVILGGGKDGYVVTALAFNKDDPRLLKGRVAIPSAYVKAIYIEPNKFAPQGQLGAYVVANKPGATPENISIVEMISRTGVDPFPGLPAAAKAKSTLPPLAKK